MIFNILIGLIIVSGLPLWFLLSDQLPWKVSGPAKIYLSVLWFVSYVIVLRLCMLN